MPMPMPMPMEKAAPVSQSPQCPTPSTTFVQADPNTFRELVQRLTGASEGQLPLAHHSNSPSHQTNANANEATAGETLTLSSSSAAAAAVKRSSSSTFKLYERRQCPRPKLQILKPGSLSKNCAHLHRLPSPSRSAFQRSDSPPTATATAISTTTDFTVTSPSGSFSNLSLRSPPSLDLNRDEEEKAIKERRFYLHPSPRSRPGGLTAAGANAEPELLPLFPLSSPRTHDHNDS